jgi:hypothetical protein
MAVDISAEAHDDRRSSAPGATIPRRLRPTIPIFARDPAGGKIAFAAALVIPAHTPRPEISGGEKIFAGNIRGLLRLWIGDDGNGTMTAAQQ